MPDMPDTPRRVRRAGAGRRPAPPTPAARRRPRRRPRRRRSLLPAHRQQHAQRRHRVPPRRHAGADERRGVPDLRARRAQPDDIGRPFADVLRERPDVVRVLSGAFELSHLPNRAELRLKELDRVIGYTLSQVKDDDGAPIGAVLFFKDLTQVEQLEERERLRDRLASLGEMAAGIAHELKNPLAGIEVMAGLLRRQVPDSTDAQSLLADIISEAKLANAIVVEMLEFVRPIRLQVERTDVADVLQQAMTLAESEGAARRRVGRRSTSRRACR